MGRRPSWGAVFVPTLVIGLIGSGIPSARARELPGELPGVPGSCFRSLASQNGIIPIEITANNHAENHRLMAAFPSAY